jgi:hypothetical protein
VSSCASSTLFPLGSSSPSTSTLTRRSATRSSRARLGAAWEGRRETTQKARGWSARRGVPHARKNPSSDEELRFVSELRPPLVFETILETTFGLARDGKSTKQGIPKNPLQLAVLADETRGMFYSSRVPVAVQEGFLTLLALLASVGRLLGYKARYPEYSGPEEPPQTEARPSATVSEAMKGGALATTALLTFVVLLLIRRRSRSSGR